MTAIPAEPRLSAMRVSKVPPRYRWRVASLSDQGCGWPRGGPWEPAHGEATWARGRPGRAPRDQGGGRQPLGGGCLGRKGDGLDWPPRQPGTRPGRVSSVPSAQLCVRCRVGVSPAPLAHVRSRLWESPLLFFAGPLTPPRFGLGRYFNLGSGGCPLADRSLLFSLQMCSGAGWSGLDRVCGLSQPPRASVDCPGWSSGPNLEPGTPFRGGSLEKEESGNLRW